MHTNIYLRDTRNQPSYPHFVRIMSLMNVSTSVISVNKYGFVSIEHKFIGLSHIFVDGVDYGIYEVPSSHCIVLPESHKINLQVFHEGE